ncbi:MAG: Eco57I restriction-modification methylase domain-containing protein [Deltaproteobacteria bacterium]|nr:Eco57I restriction-modification methylase domain-containing protein [Deltaproteobacteria bacterium]
MNETGEKRNIHAVIQSFNKSGLSKACLELFACLGYNTDRQQPLSGSTFKEFKDTYIDGNNGFNEEKALVKEWNYVDLLFQLSDEEINSQTSIFDSKKVVTSGDSKIAMESYLFFAIGLSGSSYTRTTLSLITREINKVFPMPVMVIFKYGQCITLSVINRRISKRDEQKDVLKKVTLIKDISIRNPHRAHIEILHDLSFAELLKKHKFTNFVELHEAWQKTLDIKELNKRFYQELANWYFWAMDHVSFPDDVEKNKSILNATSLIRLITRIIFIWFIKEKSLVPEMLFDKDVLKKTLKEFAKDHKSHDYYNAVLQNLFFGTLNQKMDERGFAKEGSFQTNKINYGIKNLFRYSDKFAVSEKEALALFKDIPFLNGGLFDCLDKEDEAGKVLYTDGFSRNPKKQAVVPDFLFFSPEKEYDLNVVYGTKNKHYKIKGLIDILSGYKFTITENTPIEEEIALDPELLGKVFENLLASYNPETQTTARKQTGSFYTPREIVNYMVDESLKAYLKQTLSDKLDVKEEDADTGLDILFSYTEREHSFSQKETNVLINAIDSCKILDPACGSGAFPMGILHKLVHILHKLDPKNEQWKERQLQKANVIDDPTIRDHLIADIESAFENNELDYGRKLYLIENCIYGVDIQPIAVQIAKLRFFISLIVDQRKQPDKENLGIRSLPNLETKFVAANTLLGLEKPKAQGHLFQNKEITALEDKLKNLRHRYFAAKTRKEKMTYQKEDKILRQKIASLLEKDGWEHKTAEQVVTFDPYDQNASSSFFDPEWMFGVECGFDIVIGNPPYVRADSGEKHLKLRKEIIASKQYNTLWEKWDLYIPFIERGFQLLKPCGVTTMIVSDAYCHSKYAQKSQEWFLQNSLILKLDFLSKIKVFDAGVHNIVYFYQKADGLKNKPTRIMHEGEFGNVSFLPTNEQYKLTYRVFFPDEGKANIGGILLEEICYITYGLRPSSDEHEAKGEFVTADLVSEVMDEIHCKPYVEGKHLSNWYRDTHLWLEWGTSRAPARFCRPTFPELYLVKEKLLAQRSPGPDPIVCYDDELLIFTPASVGLIPWHSLIGVRNNSLKKAARYRDEKPFRDDLPKRERLESSSRRFKIKYLLGVMNSSVARDILRANRRSNIHLYPEDWKQLPIPDVPSEQQQPIVDLVDKILNIKKVDKIVNVSHLENEINNLVYTLYNVTSEKNKIVEGS